MFAELGRSLREPVPTLIAFFRRSGRVVQFVDRLSSELRGRDESPSELGLVLIWSSVPNPVTVQNRALIAELRVSPKTFRLGDGWLRVGPADQDAASPIVDHANDIGRPSRSDLKAYSGSRSTA
jgi:hypothetical protein